MDISRSGGRPPEGLLSTLLDDMPGGYAAIDWTGAVRWTTRGVDELLGYPEGGLPPGTTTLADHLVDDPDQAMAVLHELATRGNQGPPMARRLRRGDGVVAHVEIRARFYPHVDPDLVVLHLRRYDPENAFDEFVARLARPDPLESTLQSLTDWLALLTESPVAMAFDRLDEHFRASTQVGVPAPLTGTTRLPVLLDDDPPSRAATGPQVTVLDDLSALSEAQQLACADNGFGGCWAVPVRLRPDRASDAVILIWRPDGEPPLLNHAGVFARAVQSCELALLRHERDRDMRQAAETDELTGAANRRTLFAHMAALPGADYACAYLDLDDFKQFNDTRGHQHGDRALRTVTSTLQAALRPTDLLARVGGDEFVVIAPGLDREGAVALGTRLHGLVTAIEEVDGIACRVGVSIGFAFGRDADTEQDVLDLADRAMYAAKHGSSPVAFADEGADRAPRSVAGLGHPLGLTTPAGRD